jgi:hypothetical protein
VLLLQEQQLLVLQEQQLEHEQLELDHASSSAGSTSSSISNVMLSSAASSFLRLDMMPPFRSIDDLPPAGRPAVAEGDRSARIVEPCREQDEPGHERADRAQVGRGGVDETGVHAVGGE